MNTKRFEQNEIFHEKKLTRVDGSGSWYPCSLNIRGHEKFPMDDPDYNTLQSPILKIIETLLKTSSTVDFIRGYHVQEINKILAKEEKDELKSVEDLVYFLKRLLLDFRTNGTKPQNLSNTTLKKKSEEKDPDVPIVSLSYANEINQIPKEQSIDSGMSKGSCKDIVKSTPLNDKSNNDKRSLASANPISGHSLPVTSINNKTGSGPAQISQGSSEKKQHTPNRFEFFLSQKQNNKSQPKSIIVSLQEIQSNKYSSFILTIWNSFVKAIQIYAEKPTTTQAKNIESMIRALTKELKDISEFEYNIGCYYLIQKSRKEAISHFERSFQMGELPEALFNIGIAISQLPEKSKGYSAFTHYFKIVCPSDDKNGWFIFLDLADMENNYSQVFEIFKYYSEKKGQNIKNDLSEDTVLLFLDTILLLYQKRSNKEKFDVLIHRLSNSLSLTELFAIFTTELPVLADTIAPDISTRKTGYDEYIPSIQQKRTEVVEDEKNAPKGYIFNFWGYPRPLQGIIEDKSGKRYFYRVNDIIDSVLLERLEKFSGKDRIPVDFNVRPAPSGKLYEIAYGIQLHQKEGMDQTIESIATIKVSKALPISGKREVSHEITVEPVVPLIPEKDTTFSDFSLFFLEKCNFGQIPPNKVKKSADGKGIFIGTREEALTNIKNLDNLVKSPELRTKTPWARADLLLTAAKIAYDAKLKTERIYFYLYRSLNSWGDYYLSDERVPLDPALACYFETLVVFDLIEKDSEENNEPRYALIKYLNGIVGKRLSSQQVQNSSLDKILDEFFSVSDSELDLRFDHAIILSKHSRLAKKIIINYIFTKRSLHKKTLEFINRRSGIKRDTIANLEHLTQIWDSIKGSKNDLYKQLVQGFQELQSFSISIISIEKAVELIEKNANGLVFQVDQTRLHDVKKIFLSIKKSKEESSFEERDNYLRQATTDIKNLINAITEFPTQFSVEKILPLLKHLQSLVEEELRSLYDTAIPQISIRLRAEDESFVPLKGRVIVKITIENAKFCSPVESLELYVQKSPSNLYSPVYPSTKIQRSIHGGQIQTVDIELNVSDNALKARTFTLPIKGQYNSRTINNQTTTTATPLVNLPIRLYSKEEFQKIDNRYASWADSQEVKDSNMFFGRDDLIQKMVTTLSQSIQAKGFVIYGQRRSGKSSILYHLSRALEKNPSNLVVNIGSIGGVLSEDSSRFGLLEKILWNILKELKNSQNRLSEEHHLPHLDVDFPTYEKFSNDQSPLTLFQETMDSFLKKIRGMTEYKNCCIIILIDEFSYIYEWILEGKISGNIMRNIKSFLQKDYFKIIVAGQDIMPDFMNMFSNEFAVFQPERVTYLLPVYARQLIEEPLRIGGSDGTTRYLENSVEEILDLTACNPYYIQIFCNRLVDLMNREYSIYVTRVEVDKVKEELISGQNSLSLDKFENLYNSGDKIGGQRSINDNLSVLYHIAINCEQSPCHISKIVCKTTKDISAILDDLVNRDVLTREEGDYYRIKVGLFKDWLKRNYALKSSSNDKTANPFSQFGAPITGDEFIGRTYHLDIMENRIINVIHPGNLAIIGLPRIGKTSIVKEFLRRNSDYLINIKRIPLYIDISQFHNVDDFFMGLVTSAQRKNSDIGINAQKFSSILENIKNAKDAFDHNNQVNEFFAEYRKLGYTVIYFLDEFDLISQICPDATVLQRIRNLISSDSGVKIVTISRRTLAEIERNITSDSRAASTFAGVFQDTFVSEFNDEDINDYYKKLADNNVTLSESEKKTMIDQCGTFPLYVSGIGFHLIDQKNRTGEINLLAAINEIKIAMIQNFTHIVDLLQESDSYNALNTILFTEEKIPQMKTLEFEKYGLIQNQGNTVKCSSQLFYDYLKENLCTGDEEVRSDKDDFLKILNTDEELPDVEFKTSALWSLALTQEEISHRIQDGEEAGDVNTWCLKTFGKECSKFIIAKTLAAFLNTDGGDLMIGVNEIRTPDGTIYNKKGVDKDLQILGLLNGDNSIDSYRRFITKEIIEQYFDLKITNHFSKYFTITTKKVDNRWFCRITATKSNQAIVLRFGRQDFFFVRKDTTIKQLNMVQAADYIHTHDWATTDTK